MTRFVSPVGIDDWHEFLASLTSDQIKWKYPLLSRSTAYIRCRRFYYIELIGLRYLQPYAPMHVLQYPRTRETLHEWNNIITIGIGNGPTIEIPEYQVFFLLIYFPQRLICVDYKLADHPYFTRSKARAFTDMTGPGSSDQNSLGLVTVLRDEPEALERRDPIPYDEHIVNLMQKMANMQSEIDRLRNLTNLSITLNTPLFRACNELNYSTSFSTCLLSYSSTLSTKPFPS
ncbi:hypothetical protein H5410_002960 [Solanum commersonii]|uniref:Uncharacterized protein n=1 Tax=Solanum commersonii TaxID=4109 RepID=A0A9J6B3P4_SOLCO|nr:hypothetical protein H5410_002960 [Solanum commersonii]